FVIFSARQGSANFFSSEPPLYSEIRMNRGCSWLPNTILSPIGQNPRTIICSIQSRLWCKIPPMRLKGSAMKILLTFTGVHDPFAKTSIAGEQQAGPVLTVTAAQPFDCVHLLSVPDMAKISAQTKEELQKRNQSLTVEICDAPLKDPANLLGIPKQLKSRFKKISQPNPKAEYFICVSSGIPHVDAGWLMLAARG